MPSDDYTTSTVRGSLKLKGGPSKPEGVKKKKKLKPASSEPSSSLQQALGEETSATAGKREKRTKKDGGEEEEGREDEELDEQQLRELDPRGTDGKTASERAYEEMRRKRLHERIQKEGPKTHKQRVEELNKYLSNLSEHHDMPKIGPG